MSKREALEFDGTTGAVSEYTPTGKPSRYRAKLDSLGDIKAEMARCYRESRSGLLDYQDATKAVWMLERIGKVIVDSELEARIEKLELNNVTT